MQRRTATLLGVLALSASAYAWSDQQKDAEIKTKEGNIMIKVRYSSVCYAMRSPFFNPALFFFRSGRKLFFSRGARSACCSCGTLRYAGPVACYVNAWFILRKAI